MNSYTIDVTRIEELQMISNTDELDKIFERAKSTIVNGEIVELVRSGPGTKPQKFDELSTLPDLEQYRAGVYRYL